MSKKCLVSVLDSSVFPNVPITSFLKTQYQLCVIFQQFLFQIESITHEQRETIAQNTLGQSNNLLWHAQRKMRITASRFGSICKAVTANLDALAISIIQPKPFSSPATAHGIKYEQVAVRKYESMTSQTVKPSGVWVSLYKPYIAATPDGLVDENLIVEVKCPFSIKDSYITPGCISYLTSDTELTLHSSHDYYYQIQGQLYCTQANFCDFIVYTHKDLKVLRIVRDDCFIESMLQKLDAFYQNSFKPALLDYHIYYQYKKFFW